MLTLMSIEHFCKASGSQAGSAGSSAESSGKAGKRAKGAGGSGGPVVALANVMDKVDHR